MSGYIWFYLAISFSKKYGAGAFEAYGAWWSRFMLSNHLEGIFINLSVLTMSLTGLYAETEVEIAASTVSSIFLFFASVYIKGLCIIEINKIAMGTKSLNDSGDND